MWRIIGKIRVIFRVQFERRKVDKKANLHGNWNNLYSRVFWIFLPNVIKIHLYNFELYRFKVGAFFETRCTSTIAIIITQLESWYSFYHFKSYSTRTSTGLEFQTDKWKSASREPKFNAARRGTDWARPRSRPIGMTRYGRVVTSPCKPV